MEALPQFPCGHPQVEGNIYRHGSRCRCLMCKRSNGYTYERSRMTRLPDMITAAERKLEGLYREAARYSMDELLSHKWAHDFAWNAEVEAAKIEARKAGLPDSLGVID